MIWNRGSTIGSARHNFNFKVQFIVLRWLSFLITPKHWNWLNIYLDLFCRATILTLIFSLLVTFYIFPFIVMVVLYWGFKTLIYIYILWIICFDFYLNFVFGYSLLKVYFLLYLFFWKTVNLLPIEVYSLATHFNIFFQYNFYYQLGKTHESRQIKRDWGSHNLIRLI